MLHDTVVSGLWTDIKGHANAANDLQSSRNMKLLLLLLLLLLLTLYKWLVNLICYTIKIQWVTLSFRLNQVLNSVLNQTSV